jgi:hypothetical protein
VRALAETALGTYLEVSDTAGYGEMESRESTTLARTAGVLAGPVPLALRLFAGRSPTARRLAAVSTIAGSLLTRLAWVRAGRE